MIYVGSRISFTRRFRPFSLVQLHNSDVLKRLTWVYQTRKYEKHCLKEIVSNRRKYWPISTTTKKKKRVFVPLNWRKFRLSSRKLSIWTWGMYGFCAIYPECRGVWKKSPLWSDFYLVFTAKPELQGSRGCRRGSSRVEETCELSFKALNPGFRFLHTN